MNLDPLLHYILAFTGNINPGLLTALFLMTSIGEMFGFSIPYLLETIWLLTGYHLANGTLPFTHFLLIWATSEAGRQTGAVALYRISRLGSTPLMRLYHRLFPTGQSPQPSTWSRFASFRFVRRINYLSAFSVAIGRLVWLRIPLTLTLAVYKKWQTLMIAVLLSSMVWDATYIIIGAIGRNVVPRPTHMILYSLGGLTVLYAVTLLARQLRKRAKFPPSRVP